VTSDLMLTTAALNPLSGRFEIAFEVPGSAILRKPLRFTGSIVETVEVTVTTHPLAAGAIVKDSDLAIERRPKAKVGADALGSTHDAIGFAVRSGLRADLMKPQMVHRDDNVMLVYEVPGILLTTRQGAGGGCRGRVITSSMSKRPTRDRPGTVTSGRPGPTSGFSPPRVQSRPLGTVPSR
jgi:flagella basal body P-ring formation protein FlgA